MIIIIIVANLSVFHEFCCCRKDKKAYKTKQMNTM